MDRDDSNRPGWRRLPRRLAVGLLAGLPLLGVACSGVSLVSNYPEVPAPSHLAPSSSPAPAIQPAQYTAPAEPTGSGSGCGRLSRTRCSKSITGSAAETLTPRRAPRCAGR